MNGHGEQALLCGFGDVAAGLGALAWDLGEPGALLLSQGQVRPAAFAIEEGGDAFVVAITGDDASVEATLSPRMAVRRDGDGPPGFEGIACVAEARAKGKPTVQCTGQISRWASDPLEGATTFRHLAIEGAGGALVVAMARGEPGGGGHGDEQTAGWLLAEEGSTFEETLVSTQYDAGGDPTRIGLELWAKGADQTSRAGAVRVSGSALGGVKAGGTWAGLFRCHTDGAEGLGSYLLWRA
jgi:hypothetical protein